MGRELKRVPLDFAWPINTVWYGYLNPHHVATKCQSCDGSGSSPTMRRLKDQWYGYVPFKPEDRGSVPFLPTDDHIVAFAKRNVDRSPDYYGCGDAAINGEALHLALIDAAINGEARRLCAHWNGSWCHHVNDDDVKVLVEGGRLYDFTHTWTKGIGWKPKDPLYVPTSREVNIWSCVAMGHDSINQWIVCKAECQRLGERKECAECDGEGEHWPSQEAKAKYEAWEREEPPSGNGYQIWETVSEGSPISPPFPSPEDLARHMATTALGADKGTPYATWLKFILGPGWAPSMMTTDAGLVSGVVAVSE